MDATSNETHLGKPASLALGTKLTEVLAYDAGGTETQAPRLSPDWSVTVSNRVRGPRVMLDLGLGILILDDKKNYENQLIPVLGRKLIQAILIVDILSFFYCLFS
uniref:Uncharacterized protein n=1 Tax=Nelumbo nucifera TaxID=4432 RepID=A0A822XR34_NELNU|nr:TPA_asm: hypothetical protein HUJ06_021401 [Nelumbo nucifera]